MEAELQVYYYLWGKICQSFISQITLTTKRRQRVLMPEDPTYHSQCLFTYCIVNLAPNIDKEKGRPSHFYSSLQCINSFRSACFKIPFMNNKIQSQKHWGICLR